MKPYIYEDKLETERLITRKLTEQDVTAWSEFFKDPEAIEFFPPTGLIAAEEKAKLWVEKQMKRYSENRYGLQALIEKKSGNFVGQCGLLLQEVDGKMELEVGYHIFKKYWGQGFAPEAAKLFIDYAFKNKLADSVISIIDRRNVRSQRVADKNGLVREKETKWTERNVYIYRIYRNEKFGRK